MPGLRSGDMMPVQQEADQKVLDEAKAEEDIGRPSVETHERMKEESDLDIRINQVSGK